MNLDFSCSRPSRSRSRRCSAPPHGAPRGPLRALALEFTAVVLLCTYGGFLYYQLVTHTHLFEEKDEDEDDDEEREEDRRSASGDASSGSAWPPCSSPC